MAFIELKQVGKRFGSPESAESVEVLKDIDLSVEEGEFVAIVGFSGAGKTTLINLLAGLERPTSGTCSIDGRPIEGPGHDRGVIFQNYSLLPWLTVYGNVALAVGQAFPDWPRRRRDAQTLRFVDLVGLGLALEKRPRELSGGMRQRVAVARALAMDPRVLLMDEPLGALDALTRGELQVEIARIWERQRKTALLITNTVDEALLLADRVIPLTLGPAATLGPEFRVNLPRPRLAGDLNRNRTFVELRRSVSETLIGYGRFEAADAGNVVPLPDIQPLDPAERASRTWI